MANSTMKLGPQTREAQITREAVNADARTVEVAFSSESPVERYWGVEVLDHSPRSARLGRLKDGGAVLVDHDGRDIVGVVEEVAIGADRVGRARVRFGKSARASEVFQDVVDGIRSKISVGYMLHEIRKESEKDGIATYRATDWEPYEVSFVSIPADPSVGVGRSLPTTPEIEVRIMDTITPAETPKAPAVQPAAPTVDVREVENKALTRERERVKALTDIGDRFAQFGGPELARAAIANGESVDALNAKILERTHAKAAPDAGIGLTEREAQEFSFVRLIHAMGNPADRRAQERAKYELEVSDAAADREARNGRKVQGRLIPVDVMRSQTASAVMAAMRNGRRDLTVGSATQAGNLVAENLLAGSFIDLLRNRTILDRLGITTLAGLVGNIAIPRQTGAATAYWVAESNAPTESMQSVDQVTLQPKTLGAFTDFSRKLMLQSSIDVEAMVRNDLIRVMALEIDRVGFYGSGVSNQPQGLKGATGVNTVDLTAAAPTYAEIVSLETAVASDNADIGTLAYATNALGRGLLKTTSKDTGSGMFLWEPGNTVNGYRCEVSNQIATLSNTDPDFWFGNWADLVMGMWGGLDIMVDPYTHSTSGTMRVVALQDIDFAIRHGESFCYSNKTI